MELAAPLWLLGLALIPLVVALEWWAVRRDRQRTARLVARALWPRVVARPPEGWRWVRLGLLALGVAGLAVALAGPRWGVVREKVEREGVDVVFLLDTSGSMAVEDVQPNRFFLARAALASLLDQLEGDRVGLVAVEGEAYPLVPLTLDAGAVGLFLETLEPGTVPAPGTSLGVGLMAALSLFVDEQRANKVIVLASDGEDLENTLAEGVRAVRDKGVIVHAIGVGTPEGAPVPHFDQQGQRAGYKRDLDGSVAVSRLREGALERLARETGGVYVRVTPASAPVWQIAAAVRGMEQKRMVEDYVFRPKERYQWPLGVALGAFTLAWLMPPPRRRRPRSASLAVALALVAAPAPAGDLWSEVTLQPQRATRAGRQAWRQGDFPRALERLAEAAQRRGDDPRAQFNLAAARVATGQLEEAIPALRELGRDALSPLAPAARYNLGNALFAKQDFAGAVEAYRATLELIPGDEATRRNLELALRRLREQQRQPQASPSPPPQAGNQDRQNSGQGSDAKHQAQPQQPPPSQEEQEQRRFEQAAGMPKERAMQLLEALQSNEKAELKRLLAQGRAEKRQGRDW